MVHDMNRMVATWLIICAFMVFCMVVIGGITRLTESGLSIVDWRPVTGAIPPLNEADWAIEYSKYQTSPQFQKINNHMNVEQFKSIYWWEFIHRFMGRMIGLALFLPLIYFIFAKKLVRLDAYKLFGICALVGLQGLFGWIMVASGLKDNPAVSHYRLALHLGTAFIIIACIMNMAMRLLSVRRMEGIRNGWAIRCFPYILFAQVILGAMVAGMDAGLLYPDFPKMNGQWVPDEILSSSPWWRNFLENPSTIHFQHRAFAIVVCCFAAYISVNLMRITKAWACILMAGIALQIMLGWATVASSVAVIPASAHQGVAVILFAMSLYLRYQARK